MANRIEDYAFLSDTRSAAMVSRSGSVDWLTFPRFDSPAAMAALVGTEENGHFSISPVGEFRTEDGPRGASFHYLIRPFDKE